MRLDLHVEPQKYATPEHALQVAACLDADALDHLTALAHDDALLALALNVHGGVQAQQVTLGTLKLVAHDAHGVRDLLARVAQDLLAHELGDHDLVGLVGAHALGEPARALRQVGGDHVHERLHVEALRGRHHDLVVELNEGAGRLELLEHLLRARKVGLGKNEYLGCLGGSHALGNPGIATADGRARVDHEGDDVHVRKFAQGALVELAAQAVLGLVDAGRVHDDQLAVLAVDNGAQAAARGLGDRRGDGDLLAVAGVEQRGFTGVGAADQRDKAGAEALGDIGAQGRRVSGARELPRLDHGIELIVGKVGERIEIGHGVGHRYSSTDTLELKVCNWGRVRFTHPVRCVVRCVKRTRPQLHTAGSIWR